MSVEVHEAAHAAACVWLQRPVEYVQRESGHAFPGEEIGHCRAPVADGVQARDLGVALIGYLAEAAPGWPPPFEEARHEKREALATLIRVLGVDEEQYDQFVALTRSLLDEPAFKRLQYALARALAACPRLEAEDIEALCLATGIPVPQPVGAN